MAWTKAEREEFHQLDLAVTRLEARVQALSEDIRRMSINNGTPPPSPPQAGGLPSLFGNALGTLGSLI